MSSENVKGNCISPRAANLRIGRDSVAVLKASSGCCGKSEFATPSFVTPTCTNCPIIALSLSM
ncbi:MAG: hypothetical protein PHH43_07700 [Candidatus Cloacimonetes bacterium]|nr:hypothetical protein [Candidatus Cloacimonadota bacterium]MDD3236191.1 hypothetical protein [Candidatus Cloacimonadota bacterium]